MIAWTKVDLVRSSDNHLRAISQETLQPSIIEVSSKKKKWKNKKNRANELTICSLGDLNVIEESDRQANFSVWWLWSISSEIAHM